MLLSDLIKRIYTLGVNDGSEDEDRSFCPAQFSENETAFGEGKGCVCTGYDFIYFSFFLLQMLLCQRLTPDQDTVFYWSVCRLPEMGEQRFS